MMSLEITLRLLSGIFLIAANGFFVATEFALTRLRQFPPEDFQGHAGLRRAWKMTDELEIYLTGCQVGITFTSILLGIVVEPAMTRVIEPLLNQLNIGETTAHGAGLVVGLVIINLAHTIWAEQTPTYLGVEKSKLVAKYCGIPLYWWTKAAYPLLYIGDKMAKLTLRCFGIEMTRSWTEDGASASTDDADSDRGQPPLTTRTELIRRMGALLKRGKLSEDRRREVMQAVRIEEIAVDQAMVLRDEIVALRVDEPFQESVAKIGASKHTRYPLVGESLEDFRGVVYLPEVFAHLDQLVEGSKSLAEIAAPPMSVPAAMTVSQVIDRFQAANQEIGLVMEDDKVVGLITLTDAVEMIVGESRDPLDVLVTQSDSCE